MMWFLRPESDRYGWFISDGTVRARNILNVGATTEQNLFVANNSQGQYVKMGKYGLHPDLIGNLALKILLTNKPKTRYVITPGKLMNYIIPGFLPDRWVDRLVGKMLGLIKRI